MSDIPTLPMAQALQRLREAGYLISEDKRQRWVAAGLIRPAEFIVGQNVRGLSDPDINRLTQILNIERWLPTRKVKASELAFWMAYCRIDDVPPKLVLKHVEFNTRALAAIVKRIPKRMGTGRTQLPIRRKSRVESLGKLVGKRAAGYSRVTSDRKPFLVELCQTLATAFIAKFFFTESLSFLDRPLLKLFEWVSGGNEGARTLKGLYAEGMSAIRSFIVDPADGDNKILTSVRHMGLAAPSDVFASVRAGGWLVAAMGHMLPILGAPEKFDRLSSQDVRVVKFMLPPAAVGLAIALRNDPDSRDNLAALSADKTEQLSQDAGRVRQIVEHLSAKVGGQA